MRTFAALACLAALSYPTATSAEPDEMALPVKAFLCDSADHAIQFADIRADGASEEIAKDRIGRSAGGEVCGLYAGIAMVQSEATSLQRGIAYKVTAYRFREDRRIAWLAERSFAPGSRADHHWDL